MKTLSSQFRGILRTGDEEKARAFLVEHFTEFPPEVQERLATAFFEEALTNKLEAETATLDLKEGIIKFFKDPDPKAAA